MKQKRTVKLTTSAMMIALGTAISLISEWIPFLNLPWGGTVTLGSLLPIVLISYLYGLSWGLGSAFLFSLLQMAIGFRTVSALFLPSSDSYMGVFFALCILLLDYVLAFTAVGLGGIWRNRFPARKALFWGSLAALSATYCFHVLSGTLFYGAWATWFFEESAFSEFALSKIISENVSGTGLALIYSLLYNGLYMFPEMILTSLGALAAAKLPMIQKRKKEQ